MDATITVVPERLANLISVIIPVYQGEALILGAVRSALAQTHRDIEVIVVDDGSTDATLARLATIDDPRLQVMAQANAGTAAARNAALAVARGTTVAFLDADDRWFPTKLETELRVLRDAPDSLGVVYSSYYAVDDDGRLLNPAPRRRVSGRLLDVLLDGEDFLMPSVCLFDRRIFDHVGGFRVHRFHEDHDLILRVAKAFPMYPTGERLVVYRQSTAGKCRSIMADFERARNEELSLVSDFAGEFEPDQIARLERNVIRSLYCRFLMYGFASHARRLLGEFDVDGLRTTKKGLLAWFFAKTGVNLLILARRAIQAYYLIGRQGPWNAHLAQAGLDLAYGSAVARLTTSGAAPRNVRVCIAIPTFRRPELLRALLEGIGRQTVDESCWIEVVVLDNDSQTSARHVVEEARAAMPFPMRYEHVAEPGLSSVRNAALAHAADRFDFLAMIDDDEYPQPQWLSELLRVQRHTGADAVVGPVPKTYPQDTPAWIRSGRFYDLPGYPDGAPMRDGYSGNCLLSIPTLARLGVTFDHRLNLAGGEDLFFFRQLLDGSATMVFAAGAVAFETIGHNRLTFAYLVRLSFRRGNSLAFCDRLLNGSARGLTLRALKGCGRVALGWATFIPLSLARGKAGAATAACNIAHGLGSIVGLAGYIHDGYKRA